MNRPESIQHISAGGMSLLVHGLFIVFLLFSVSWHSQPHPQVDAELWSTLPEPLAPPPPLPPQPLPPPPQPRVAPPEAVKPEPAKPDIALEREKKRKEQEARKEEALRQKEADHQAELQRLAEEKARSEKEQADKAAQAEKLKQEQKRREAERKQVEQDLARQAREELDAEDNQLRGVALKQQALANVAAGRRAQLIRDAQERIRSRIRAYLRLPQNLLGNPEAVFQVALLPNGEVLRTVLVHSSGQPAYDQEVERAILKASPLPLPPDRDAANAFREGLILKFRPREDAAGGHQY